MDKRLGGGLLALKSSLVIGRQRLPVKNEESLCVWAGYFSKKAYSTHTLRRLKRTWR